MTLYHGSNIEVSQPKLLPRVRALDFGRAFYLTSDFPQASKWAKTSVLRRGNGNAIVSVFHLPDELMMDMKILQFDAPDSRWLEFVARNRNAQVDDSDADIIIGPVANDNTMPVLNLYFKGAYTQEEALRRLLPQHFCNQYAFKTERALNALVFNEAIAV